MTDTKTVNVPFKFVFDVEKAEERNGARYVYGVASGLGVDDDGHEMDASAIERFAQQINDRAAAGDPVPYVDWHGTTRSIMAELGTVQKAMVDDQYRLGVEVLLDEDNPNAEYHYKKLKKGKQYGMSVAGKVLKFAKSFNAEQGREVLRFFEVVIDEISATTKPRWTQSLGTVLAKAVMDSEGDTPVTDEARPDGTDVPADGTPNDIELPESEETQPDAEPDEAVDVEPVDEDIEKAGKRISRETSTRLLGLYAEMTKTLTELGLLASEDDSETITKAEGDEPADPEPKPADDADSPSPTDEPAPDAPAEPAADPAPEPEPAEPQKSPELLALEARIAELTAENEALRNSPSPKPPVLAEPEPAKDPMEEIRKELEGKSPFERIALGLQLASEAKRK